MKRILTILFVLLSVATFGQTYQAMPQAGYGPVKRMRIDSVLSIPIGIPGLRNITGGKDTGQIRYVTSDSSIYVFTGSTWVKAGGSGGGPFTTDTIVAKYPIRIDTTGVRDTIYLAKAFLDSVYNGTVGFGTGLITAGVVQTDTVINITPPIEWKRNGTVVTQNTGQAFPITRASTNNYRTDLIYINGSDVISYIQGIESVINPAAPVLPVDGILITYVNVFDTTVNAPGPSPTTYQRTAVVYIDDNGAFATDSVSFNWNQTTKDLTISSLGGTGTRMVVASPGGVLSTQPISSGGTVTSVGLTTGTSGTDINVGVGTSPVTTSGTITLNIPDASATARGVVTTGTQTFAGAKTFSSNLTVNSARLGTNSTNHFFGTNALGSLASGSNNTSLGYFSSILLDNGSGNTAVGAFSQQGSQASISYSNNTTLGFNTLRNIGGVGNSNNTVVGASSLSNISGSSPNFTGSNNTVLGANILTNVSSLSNNVILGDGLGNIRFRDDGINTLLSRLAGTGTRMVTAGTNGELSTQGINFWNTAGNSDVDASKFIGSTNNATLRFRTNNVERMVIDSSSGIATFNSNISAGGIAVGSKLGNTIVGNFTLTSLTSGTGNTAIGSNILTYLTSGNNNTAIGQAAASVSFSSGSDNTLLGRSAMGFKTGGSSNVAIGNNAFYGVGFGSANENTIVGTSNFSYMSSGDRNTSVGFSNLGLCTSGSNNTIIGSSINLNPTSYTLSNNVILGDGQGNVRFRNTGSSTYLNGNVGIGNFNMGSLTPTPSSYLLHVEGTAGAVTQYMTGNLFITNGGLGTNTINAQTNIFDAVENRISSGHLTRSASWTQGDIIDLSGNAPINDIQPWCPITLQTGTVTRASGTASNGMISLKPTYNFTGTYAGETVGIEYRPSITNLNGTSHIALRATSGQVVIGAITPAVSAAVDITSTTQGFLPPRMTGTQAENIVSPAEGLMVYATSAGTGAITSKGWWGYDGTTWVKLN